MKDDFHCIVEMVLDIIILVTIYNCNHLFSYHSYRRERVSRIKAIFLNFIQEFIFGVIHN